MRSRPGWIELAAATVLLAGCGIDGALTDGDDGGPRTHADASVNDGSGSGSGGGQETGGQDTGSESGFPDAAPVCDSGSSLGGACSNNTGCCFPLSCTTPMTCQWACTGNGPCTGDVDCCLGSYCGPAGKCTCVQDLMPCTSDSQCCSIINGGGCDHQGDSGRVCGNN